MLVTGRRAAIGGDEFGTSATVSGSRGSTGTGGFLWEFGAFLWRNSVIAVEEPVGLEECRKSFEKALVLVIDGSVELSLPKRIAGPPGQA